MTGGRILYRWASVRASDVRPGDVLRTSDGDVYPVRAVGDDGPGYRTTVLYLDERDGAHARLLRRPYDLVAIQVPDGSLPG